MNRLKNHAYSARLALIFFLFCFAYAIIVANFYRIQIRQHDFFQKIAQDQYLSTVTLQAFRAPMYDRTGKTFLAMNKECVSAYLIPTLCEEPDAVDTFLSTYFPTAARRFQDQRSSAFLYIKRRLSDYEQSLIKQVHLDDIQLICEESRYYPISSAGIITGITDIDNKGLFGIELQCDHYMAGKPMTFIIEKDARSGLSYFKKTTTIAGEVGTPIMLTIDSVLQFLVHEELSEGYKAVDAQEGAVLVIDPKSGDILAMVSLPDFDPNDTQEIDFAKTKNRVITERYELGSVIKVCAALAALQEQVVNPDEIIDCKSSRTAWIDGRKINTVKAHGVLPFWEVVARSNNIGMAIVAKRLDKKLYEHYVRMGFNDKTGITFPGEQCGTITSPHVWSKQSIISLSYGYEIAITLLQLAQFFGMIANDGIMVPPRLILQPSIPQKLADNKSRYDQQHIDTIKMILEKTTQEGTARKAAINGYRIMSKTGTANTLVDGVYSTESNLFTCAGIIEKDDYQRVIVVFLHAPGKYNRYASTVAAPLFERIAEKVLIHDRVIV